MLRKLALTLALSAALTAPAFAGTKRCPALQAGQGDVCDCIVENYAQTVATGVTINVLGAGFGNATCGPVTVGAGAGSSCAFTVTSLAARCGCQVTGASNSTRVSLSIEGPAITDGAKVAVPCQ